MSSVRLEKIGALIKKELALVFQQNMSTSFNGMMITVTNVRISPDLSIAKIYLSFFPSEKKTQGLALVESKNGWIRKILGISIAKQIRKIPELHFYMDDSMDYFLEIDRLLKK
jgi:ribosome-binding factor A